MRVKKSAASAENAEEFAITMAMDAFRHCIGVKPRKHSLREIILWMQLMAQKPINKAQGKGE